LQAEPRSATATSEPASSVFGGIGRVAGTFVPIASPFDGQASGTIQISRKMDHPVVSWRDFMGGRC